MSQVTYKKPLIVAAVLCGLVGCGGSAYVEPATDAGTSDTYPTNTTLTCAEDPTLPGCDTTGDDPYDQPPHTEPADDEEPTCPATTCTSGCYVTTSDLAVESCISPDNSYTTRSTCVAVGSAAQYVRGEDGECYQCVGKTASGRSAGWKVAESDGSCDGEQPPPETCTTKPSLCSSTQQCVNSVCESKRRHDVKLIKMSYKLSTNMTIAIYGAVLGKIVDFVEKFGIKPSVELSAKVSVGAKKGSSTTKGSGSTWNQVVLSDVAENHLTDDGLTISVSANYCVDPPLLPKYCKSIATIAERKNYKVAKTLLSGASTGTVKLSLRDPATGLVTVVEAELQFPL